MIGWILSGGEKLESKKREGILCNIKKDVGSKI